MSETTPPFDLLSDDRINELFSELTTARFQCITANKTDLIWVAEIDESWIGLDYRGFRYFVSEKIRRSAERLEEARSKTHYKRY